MSEQRPIDMYCPVCAAFRAVPNVGVKCDVCDGRLGVPGPGGTVRRQLVEENVRLRKAVWEAMPIVAHMAGDYPPQIGEPAAIWMEEYADLFEEPADG